LKFRGNVAAARMEYFAQNVTEQKDTSLENETTSASHVGLRRRHTHEEAYISHTHTKQIILLSYLIFQMEEYFYKAKATSFLRPESKLILVNKRQEDLKVLT
jgi:hypothetical protein